MDARRFGRLTPREFHYLRRAWEDREDRLDFRTFSIVAGFFEIHRDKDKKPQPFTALDLFTPRRKRKAASKLSPEDEAKNRATNMKAFVAMLNEAMGGRDLRQPEDQCPS